MLNYLKSEIYRILHTKSSYIFIAVCSLLLLSSNIVIAFVKMNDATFPYADTAFAIGNVCGGLIYVFLMCIMVAGTVFNNEHNNHTFKNCVSYGIPRGTIYFGKVFVQIIYAITAFIIILGVHVGSAYLLLENSGPMYLDMMVETCLALLPLFIFSLTVANCFYFILEGTGAAMTASVGIILAMPLAFNFLGMKFEIFRTITRVLPWNLLIATKPDMSGSVSFYWEQNGMLGNWLAGILQALLFIVIGYVIFRKKEIK
jgi:ABC-type transport system involved in multi-copper enzyme maturation permease subunit